MKEPRFIDPVADFVSRLERALGERGATRTPSLNAFLTSDAHDTLRNLARSTPRPRPRPVLRLSNGPVPARRPSPWVEAAGTAPRDVELDLDDVIDLPAATIIELLRAGFLGLRYRDAEIPKRGLGKPRQEICGLYVTKFGAMRANWGH